MELHKTARKLVWTTRSRWGKLVVCTGVLLMLATAGAYGVSYWYRTKHRAEPIVFGATFIDDYAEELGVDPRETLQAAITDLGIRRFRLVSYWNDHEPEPGQYQFADLDWQFDMIERAGGSISLSVGLRQPRWPECHGPTWAMQKPSSEWSADLNDYITVVVNRYKHRDVLVEYQLENEFLLDAFGECPDHNRDRLIAEFELLRSLDDTRPIILTRSNNATPSWPVGEPRGDRVGAAVYKRIWDRYVTRRYVEYPYPPWFYGFLAGATELATGRPSVIHELQTEAWLPEGFSMRDAPLSELYRSFGPDHVASRLDYAADTGIRQIDVWGIEWWYQLKTNRDAPEIWDTARTELQRYNK